MSQVKAPTTLLTIREVADRLAVNEHCVRYLCREQRLPYVRLGPKLLRFRSEDVQRLAEEGYEGEPLTRG